MIRSNKLIAATFVLALFMPMMLHAQYNPYLKVDADPILDSIITAQAEAAKANPGMQGFRIQIYSNSDRKTANDIRTKFLQMAPETEAYLTYHQPYFRVRVGDYRNRFEAYPMYRRILNEFDNVLIVPDRINLPKLMQSESNSE